MPANWRGVLLLFSFGQFLDNTHKLLLCVNARLGVDALDMGPNSVFRQDEVFRDVASRTSTGQIAQNLPLAPRESARSSDVFNPSFERIVDRVRIARVRLSLRNLIRHRRISRMRAVGHAIFLRIARTRPQLPARFADTEHQHPGQWVNGGKASKVSKESP